MGRGVTILLIIIVNGFSDITLKFLLFTIYTYTVL